MKMKIKIYITTYNNDSVLRKNIDLIKSSDAINYDYSIYVINNYSKLENFDDVIVLDNILRPDFSCGHLSRSWNQSIINGFKDLENPDCDLLILMQNDVFVKADAFSKIIDYMSIYDFLQVGAGDQLMVFNANAIKRIGIFDERFCSIAFQEADYFLSAVILHSQKVSINDLLHRRFHNKISSTLIENDFSLNKNSYEVSDVFGYHDYNYRLFLKKWNMLPENWSIIDVKKPQIERYMFYPYFEKKILTLNEQNYFL